jgi:O-antigen ligase
MIWLLLGYMFLFIYRPFEVWPALGEYHLERLYMLGTLLAVLAWPGKRWIPNRHHFAFGAFGLAVLVCWLVSPWGTAGEQVVEDFFKILVFYVLLILVVQDEKDLKLLLSGFLGIMALYMAHSLWEYSNGRHVYRMGIERLVGVDTTMGDPNSFGATIVYVLPFVAAFWLDPAAKHWRWFLAGFVALSVICIGLTGSRSAFVGLLLGGLLMLLRSQGRLRLGALALLAAPLLWAALPLSLQNRFETIIDPDVGPENAKTSAEGRIEGLRNGVKLWEENPLTGCGPGAWRKATGSTIESHNLYGQLMGEMGSLGVVTFAAVLCGYWINVRWIRKVYQQHPDWGHDFLYQVAHAIGISVLLLLFLGNVGHNLFRYSWYWYGGFLIITRACVEQRLRQQMIMEQYADLEENAMAETDPALSV